MMRLFFHAYSSDVPSGGQRDTYCQVDVLRRLGKEAFIFHSGDAARITWFAHNTPTLSRRQMELMLRPSLDYLILPEDIGQGLRDYPGRKVIFVKNVWSAIAGSTENLERRYLNAGVVALMAMSRHNQAVLARILNTIPVLLVKPYINETLFLPRPLSQRTKRIAFVPKMRKTIAVLQHLVRAGGRSNAAIEWIELIAMSEEQVAEVLRNVTLLVFISAEEGLGRTVLEAMATGCLVVGFDNGTLGEIVPQELLFRWGALEAMAQYIIEVIEATGDDLVRYDRVIDIGMATAAEYFTYAHEHSVATAWARIEALASFVSDAASIEQTGRMA